MPHEDTANFNLEDIDDNDEEVDERDETSTPEAPAAVKLPKHSRRPRKTNNGAHAVGMGAQPQPAWKYQEADLLWPEVLESLRRSGLSPHDFVCRISKLPEKQHLYTLECADLTGEAEGKAPGDALIDRVTDYVHLRWTQSPQRYDIAFVQKVGAKIYARGILSLPSGGEIMAIRSAKVQLDQSKPLGMGMPPPAMPPMHVPAPVPPPSYTPPYAGVGAPPMASASDEVAFLRRQLEAKEQQAEAMRQEVLTAAREGRQPNIAVAAQPEDRIARLERLVERLIETRAAPVGVGAPPPPPAAPSEMAAQTADGVNSFEGMIGNFRRVKAAMKQARELFAEYDDDEEEEEPEKKPDPVVAAPAKPEDTLPWNNAEVPGAKWGNGSSVQFARNKETGDIDWTGLAMSNPHIAEKIVDMANRLGEGILGAAQRFAQSKLPPGVAGAPAATEALPQGQTGGGTPSSGSGTPNI
jgi:hypothetical protein